MDGFKSLKTVAELDYHISNFPNILLAATPEAYSDRPELKDVLGAIFECDFQSYPKYKEFKPRFSYKHNTIL